MALLLDDLIFAIGGDDGLISVVAPLLKLSKIIRSSDNRQECGVQNLYIYASFHGASFHKGLCLR